MEPILNPQSIPTSIAPSPRGHRSLQELVGYHSPRSQSLIQEPEVAYFSYNSEISQQDSLEVRLVRLFKNLPYSSKLKNPSSPVIPSKASKKFPRNFKICFEVYENNPAEFRFSAETRRLFLETLPYIDFIELSGDHGFLLFYSLMEFLGYECYEEKIQISSFRLLIRTPLDHSDVERLCPLLSNNLSINQNLIKQIAFENQSLDGDDWRALLSSLGQEVLASEQSHTGKIIIANCSWTHLFTQPDAVVFYNAQLDMGQKLSDFIDVLPASLAELDIRSSFIDTHTLINNPAFITSCRNYFERAARPLTLTLSPGCFKTITAEDINLIIQLELQDVLVVGDIFTKISWPQLIDYLWYLESSQHYKMLLEKYSGNTIAEIQSLPVNPELFTAFIQALPSSFSTIKFKLPILNLNPILNCPSLLAALQQRYTASLEPSSSMILDASDASKVQINLDSLYKILELSSCNVQINGIAKHITPQLWAKYLLLQENLEQKATAISMELLSRESLRAIESYCDSESQRRLYNLPLGNQVFLLSDLAPKSTPSGNTSLLRLLLEAPLPSESLLCLRKIHSKEFAQVDWNCRYSRTLHIALRLWRYALNQECPLSLQPEYIQRMLSEPFNPFEPTPLYGLAQVSFDALPKIVTDSLSKTDTALIQSLLKIFYTRLTNCPNYKTEELLYPFSLCESHDPTAYIFRQETLRRRQAAKAAVEKQPEPIVLSSTKPNRPLQIVFYRK